MCLIVNLEDEAVSIVSFRHKGLEELFIDGSSRLIDSQLQRKLRVILAVLDSAVLLSDAASLTGFHPLSGDRKGYYAVTVTGNWRVAFRFETGRTIDVEFIDYH